MGIVLAFTRGKSFSPETLQAMSEAFDRASAFMMDHSDEASEALAMRIITRAAAGERNPTKLAAAALAGFATVGSAH
jgi:hypothetical protein